MTSSNFTKLTLHPVTEHQPIHRPTPPPFSKPSNAPRGPSPSNLHSNDPKTTSLSSNLLMRDTSPFHVRNLSTIQCHTSTSFSQMNPSVQTYYDNAQTTIHPIVTKQMYVREASPPMDVANLSRSSSAAMYQHSMLPHSSKSNQIQPTPHLPVPKKRANRKRKQLTASISTGHVPSTKRHPNSLALIKKRPSDVGSIGPFRDGKRPSLVSPLLERSAISPGSSTGRTTGAVRYSEYASSPPRSSPHKISPSPPNDENTHPYDEYNQDDYYRHELSFSPNGNHSYYDDEDYFQRTPRETLEEIKKRESQALRQMNQDLLQKKKRQQMKEQEQRRQQILHEKRSKSSKIVRPATSTLRHPVEFVPSKSLLTEDQISPRMLPSAPHPEQQVTSRIATHMNNIRRKILQRKSVDGTDISSTGMLSQRNDSASRSSLSRPMSSRYLHSAMLDQYPNDERESLFGETPDEYEDNHQEPVSPLSARVQSRPITAKLNYMRVGSAGQSRKSQRTYSEYPAPVRYNPEVYRQEREEVQLMKQIRQLHSAEDKSKKAFSVRLGKIRGKEAKIKFEHKRESYFKEARKDKDSIRQSLLEKQQKMEDETQRIRERIQLQKQHKQKWKKEREFFVQFSCRHNMISKQLTTTTIKSKQEENQIELQEKVNSRKKEMEERKEHLQNIMFKELNRKRAMVAFGNYQTKKELEQKAQEKRRQKREKAKEVREWEKSKRFTISDSYADYSILAKKRNSNANRQMEPQSARDHAGLEEADEALAHALNLHGSIASPSSIASPRSSRPSSAVTKKRSRPKSALPSSARYSKPRLGLISHPDNESDDDFEFDAQRDPQRPSSAHAPLKIAEN